MDSECENRVLAYSLIVPMTGRWRPSWIFKNSNF